MTSQQKKFRLLFTKPILSRFFLEVLIWSIPSILILPIALGVILISVLGREGELISLLNSKLVGVFSALGPLFILSSSALGVLLLSDEYTAEMYLSGGFTALILLVVGCGLIGKTLRRIDKEVSRTQTESLF